MAEEDENCRPTRQAQQLLETLAVDVPGELQVKMAKVPGKGRQFVRGPPISGRRRAVGRPPEERQCPQTDDQCRGADDGFCMERAAYQPASICRGSDG